MGRMTDMPEDLEYERKYSHSHCWAQGGKPACGQPLEKHKQCCLCDTVYRPRKKSIDEGRCKKCGVLKTQHTGPFFGAHKYE